MTPVGFDELLAELRAEEGCRLKAYQDREGSWTIGWGHTGPGVRQGLSWTQAQADAQLKADAALAESECARAFDFWLRLDDARQGVLIDMAFNLGLNGLSKFTHMLSAIQQGDYEAAATSLLASEPWRSQVGSRAERLAARMRSGSMGDPSRYQPTGGVASHGAARQKALYTR